MDIFSTLLYVLVHDIIDAGFFFTNFRDIFSVMLLAEVVLFNIFLFSKIHFMTVLG